MFALCLIYYPDRGAGKTETRRRQRGEIIIFPDPKRGNISFIRRNIQLKTGNARCISLFKLWAEASTKVRYDIFEAPGIFMPR